MQNNPAIRLRPVDAARAAQLQAEGLTTTLARVYAARGIVHAKEAHPPVSSIIPHAHLHNAGRAATLLADAIAANRRILVVSDYDADGATGCAVAVRALRSFGARVDYLIPSRFTHGYGLTPPVVELAVREKNPDIILTVDNGIASVEGVAAATAAGVQVIVTDHHLAGETLPEALCIVNPNQPADTTFTSKALAGVGVVWYVMWALYDELNKRGYDNVPKVSPLLPIVALGTVADVVPLDLNNRALVLAGIQMIRKGQSPIGMQALAAVAKVDLSRVTTTDFGFFLGPRINAAGRLEHMDSGVDLLLTEDTELAQQLATHLDEVNRERKQVQKDIEVEAETIALGMNIEDRFTIAVAGEWHEGVIGVAAGKLKEAYHRPTFVFTRLENGNYKGSGRSIPGFHLRDAMDLVEKRAPGTFIKFGGHAMAAGATLAADRLATFQTVFEDVAKAWLKPEDLGTLLEVDGEPPINELTVDLARALSNGCWGQGFPAPLFRGTFKVVDVRRMGTEKQHTKLVLERDDQVIEAVRFFWSDDVPPQVDAVFNLSANTFRGETNPQLMLQHLAPVGTC